MTSTRMVALVSGSTRGIGKVIAEHLVLDGFSVIQNSRSNVDPEEIIGEAHKIADVTNYEECKKLVTEVLRDYGKIDLLVCNVGSGRAQKMETSSAESRDYYLRTNLHSAMNLVEIALESLIQVQGNVIAISSICGEDPTIEAPIGYSTAKAGLNMFMKTMAARYGKQGVRFNVIAPGNVYFQGSVWDHKLAKNRLDVEAFLNQKVPMGRFIEPQEIASAVSFLAGTNSRSITGVVLPIDGGQSL